MQNIGMPKESFKPPDPLYAERVRSSFDRQPFMHLLGAELSVVGPGYCEIHLPYRKALSQQHGFFHAGVIGTLADNAGGYAAFSLMPPHASVLTVEYKLNLLAPGQGGRLKARGRALKAGRTLTVCRCEVWAIHEGMERLCATCLMTVMTLPGRPDRPPET